MDTGKPGFIEILVPILFIGSSIFRLARFNITIDDGYIRGLPITIAGIIMSIKYIIDINFRLIHINYGLVNYENSIIMIILSLLMISNFKIKKPL